MFTRIDLCALAGIDTDRFKSLWHRRQLPLRQTNNARARRAELYSPLDVLTLAVGECLAGRVGGERGLSAAGAMIVAAMVREWTAIAYASPAAADVWAACIASRSGRIRQNGELKTIWYSGGALAHVVASAIGDRQNDQAAIRVFMINLSEVVRDVKARAKQAHIYFPEAGEGKAV